MPTFAFGTDAAQDLDRAAVGEQEMVRRRQRVGRARPAGSVAAVPVALPRGHARLVQRDPALDPVAEPAGDDLGVLAERVDGIPVRPAAEILESLRQVPVIERHERADAALEQLVEQPVVEVQPVVIHASAPVRQDPRPRDREAESVDAELPHERDVLGIAMVEVARDLARVAVADLPRRGAEPVPDALAPAVLVGGAFDLERRGRGAPDEICGELDHVIARHGFLSVQVDGSMMGQRTRWWDDARGAPADR